MSGKVWTDFEISILKDNYSSQEKQYLLELLPGRSWYAVCVKAHKLHIKRGNITWGSSKKKVEFYCKECNIFVRRFQNPNNRNVFCSKLCYNKWKKSHPEENYFHKFPRVGKLNGNWGRHANHVKNVDMKVIDVLGRKKQQYHTKPAKPEIALYKTLDDLLIIHERQKPILSYTVDAFIEPNIALEVDGEYWHNFPHGKESDRLRDAELRDIGIMVYRYWAKDILNKGTEVLQWLIDAA